VLSVEFNIESKGVVKPESDGKISNVLSDSGGELYKTISPGSFKDVICCSVGTGILLCC
jgi:hypothetical protein